MTNILLCYLLVYEQINVGWVVTNFADFKSQMEQIFSKSNVQI